MTANGQANGQPIRLDFSHFHPQDHRAFSPTCWSLPRGPWGHLGDWWRYRSEWTPHYLILRVRHLFWRQHSPQAWYRGSRLGPGPEVNTLIRIEGPETLAFVTCQVCHEELPDEAAEAASWPRKH